MGRMRSRGSLGHVSYRKNSRFFFCPSSTQCRCWLVKFRQQLWQILVIIGRALSDSQYTYFGPLLVYNIHHPPAFQPKPSYSQLYSFRRS